MSRSVSIAAVVLLLAGTAGDVVGQDAGTPTPAEWNRFQRRMQALEAEVRALRIADRQRSIPSEDPVKAEFVPASSASGMVDESRMVHEDGAGNRSVFDSESGYVVRPIAEVFGSTEYPTVRVTGFFHLDAAWFHQSRRNRRTLGDIQDGVTFRRARVGITGNVTETISYMMEFDFEIELPAFVDVWLDVAEVPGLGNVRIGRWRQPFGMTELTSIRQLPFLERPLPFAMSPFRQTGIGFYDHSDAEDMTWAVSVYRFPTDAFGNTVGDNGGWGWTGRATMLPIDEGDGGRLVHMGAGYSFNDPARDLAGIGFPPEVFVGQTLGGRLPAPTLGVPNFVDTGDVPTDDINLFNLEAAAGNGTTYLQSEIRWAVFDRLDRGSATFPAAYVHLRHILTGETLPYNRESGVFGGIEPHENFRPGRGGPGAWELAARWSWIDLDEQPLPGPGRSLVNLTLGLNWYWNAYAKFQLNYIHAFLDDPSRGESDAGIFALRAQLAF